MKLCLPFVLAVTVALVEGRGWWMEQPYDNQDFNVRVEYGDDVNIPCDGDPRLDAWGDYNVDYWVIPDMTIMRPDDYIDFKTLDGQAGWTVSSDGKTMELFIITEFHFGFYYCLASNASTGEEIMVKKAVNYQGPYFDDLWDDYRLNTIIGLSSSITFLAITGGVYGLMLFMDYRKAKKNGIEPVDDDEKEAEKKQREMEGGEGFANGAYVAEMKEKDGGENSNTQEEQEEVAEV